MFDICIQILQLQKVYSSLTKTSKYARTYSRKDIDVGPSKPNNKSSVSIYQQ